MQKLAGLPRAAFVATAAIGAAFLTAAAAVGSRWLALGGLFLVAAALGLIVTRIVHEQRQVAREGAHTAADLAELREIVEQLSRDRDRLVERVRGAESRTTELTRWRDRAEGDIARDRDRIRDTEQRIAAIAADAEKIARNAEHIGEQERVIAGLRAALTRAEETATALRHDASLRGEVHDRAIAAIRRSVADLSREIMTDLGPIPARRHGSAPLLSIAIPLFNRPDEVEGCLDSIAVEATGLEDLIEVCITDDASTDRRAVRIAHDFAEKNEFASLHLNEQNIGLERNLIRACVPCTGRYLLIMGNDDAFVPGALADLITRLSGSESPVHLYEKRRVDSSFARVDDIPGSTPIEIEPDAIHRFESPIAVAESIGALSAFGFVSQVVTTREAFVGIDPTPYLGLNLYPHVGIILEAFDGLPVDYHNTQLTYHRTTSRAEKWAESIGRPEEDYMQGGDVKLGTYFGHRQAAFLHRLSERSSLTAEKSAKLPERLFTSKPMREWVAANISIGDRIGITLPEDVLEDSMAWLRAVGAAT